MILSLLFLHLVFRNLIDVVDNLVLEDVVYYIN